MTDLLKEAAMKIVLAVFDGDMIPEDAVAEWLKVRDWDTQTWVDHTCHYRNLAIHLGAKPEQMLDKYDRDLCENPPPDDGSGWSTTDTVELWEDNLVLEAALRSITDRHPDALPGEHPAVDIAREALRSLTRSHG